jgi:carbon storage regulator CsrA
MCDNRLVTVTVLAVKGNRIRVGVTAPKSVAARREAIDTRIAAERATDPAFDLSRVLAIRRAAQPKWLP